jgi:hypothetical protein
MPRPQSCVVDPDLNLGRQKWPKKKAKLWIRICIDFFGWIRFQLAKNNHKKEKAKKCVVLIAVFFSFFMPGCSVADPECLSRIRIFSIGSASKNLVFLT